MSSATATQSLVDLAAQVHGALSAAEQELLERAERGEPPGLAFDPDADIAGDGERQIRSDLLRWLCVNAAAAKRHRGLLVVRARIVGRLDLSRCPMDFALVLQHCWIEDGIELQASSLAALDLRGSECGSLAAEGLEVGSNIWLSHGFRATGEVNLTRAKAGGTLHCTDGRFSAPGGKALVLDLASIGGNLNLDRGFRAAGAVTAVGTTVAGELDCRGARLLNRRGAALFADRIEVAGDLRLNDGCRAAGEVSLRAAKIGAGLDCGGSVFLSRTGRALSIYRATVGGNVWLNRQFVSRGEVSLLGATISGILYCDAGRFHNPGKCALRLNASRIEDDVYLSGQFRARGAVDLTRADLAGDLNCRGGAFVDPRGTAVNGADLRIAGNLLLDRARILGGLSLHGATITGNLSAEGARVLNRGGMALNLESAKIDGMVSLSQGCRVYGLTHMVGARLGILQCEGGCFLNQLGQARDGLALVADYLEVATGAYFGVGFRSNGGLRLDGCRIKGDLSFYQAIFSGSGVNGLAARKASIGGQLVWTEVTRTAKTHLNLTASSIGLLRDDRASWPNPGRLEILGATYDAILPDSADQRVDWLLRQPTDGFHAQPYEHLAALLRRNGREAHAIRIGMAKQDARHQRGGLGRLSRAWSRLKKVTIGYGYKPQRALSISFLFVVLGAWLFGWGHQAGLMIPTDGTISSSELPAHYPAFSALTYALDTFLPIVDLNQDSNWQPADHATCALGGWELPCGWGLRLLLRLQILFGWLLTTLLVAGVSGLIRKD